MELKDAIRQAMTDGSGCIARQIGVMKARYVLLTGGKLLRTESYGPLGGLSPLVPWEPDIDDFNGTDWTPVPAAKVAGAPLAPAKPEERGPCTMQDARESVCRAICEMTARGVDLESDGRCASYLADALCKLAEAEANLNTIQKEAD
ncbi:hypothetical protein [Ethanoligenens harbinense]|uniref:Uncharacterized protein n=1 Tax=Ethanoligenens harbinense (strain DSM 18485 / JCM 12961 / CGMCC 1.5033 / YUAN-3) TaxID=663278 RepID=E6U5Z1_ETHHY|nr:hypothetical protein [Ethanoligenens harbinense]ADU25670.1 hypothetical protein Ethha_0080 [Ethanoligenens harbinense YUAN-3]ADU26095.1 hypothetical protein Ethha_0510 [Ethanoligenens harbinense YUAN-3]AVQ94846.1 hypothetical protein CXQ68_00410 [Ethanoligenens harbinense YUAN-3]AVQ95238.1 hypothetical protein CXQ68_02645 [Ethanoligenens harbinense YUAN-3]AYF37537.1 hypothetical protein CXP51_00415 [Ethanoligenens harbinense]